MERYLHIVCPESKYGMDKESHFAKIIADGYFLPESLTVCLYYCTL